MSKLLPDSQIVIYGGGIAGASLAKALSRSFQVTLVDPNDYFEVPMAAPRNLVKPEFAERAIIPFAEALPRVKHIRGSLVELRREGGLVELLDGQRQVVRGQVTVLATGSAFSNSLMRAIDGATASERKAFYSGYQQRIHVSKRILIVGGGPIGVEVAGEISEVYSDKSITILEGGPRLLAGTSKTAADHAAKVLQKNGVQILLNERLQRADGASSDVFAPAGEALTEKGRRIPYDLLIWCVGGKPNTGYMKPRFASTLNSAGRIRVGSDLRVIGMDRVFALGDITDLDENKMAWHIAAQVKNASHNIRAVLANSRQPRRLKAHKPQTGNPMMAITLGSRNGVLHLPVVGVVRSPAFSRMAKAGHMLVPKYRKILGV
ncbi:NAD(P)/FAD-dependent oxidoreductase [Burkholderia cenocepacia]|uniref:NAD(P)/FAD-dependent oxidoreductase n=1 Tax=Burkholderia cenocepacia TaxID=95486 RepID=UPI002AB07524|nr:FAD-dependent oxidoreductase [Burkholderia cenocepacia]